MTRVYSPRIIRTSPPGYGQKPAHVYKYTSLPSPEHTRLATLAAGSFNDQISIDLTPYWIKDDVEFEALSYTWGDSKRLCVAKCNGVDVSIRANLCSALQNLRHEHKPRVLWIDGLCINQQDFSERKAQVLLMGKIYDTASSVAVWLGDEAVDSAKGMELMKKLSATSKSTDASLLAHLPINSWADLKPLDLPAYGSSDWNAIDALFWRPWFRRMWIIQEISLAKKATVHCGSDWISWDELIGAVEFLCSSRISGMVGIAVGTNLVYQLARVWRSYKSTKVWLHTLLINSLDSAATDPRDHIYALLGLASDATTRNIEVNYRMEVSDLFTSVAIQMVQREECLNVLNSCSEARPPVTPKLPSWVPDWASWSRARSILNLPTTSSFDATRGSRHTSQFSSNRQLCGRGYEIDEIQYSTKSIMIIPTFETEPMSRMIGEGNLKLFRNNIYAGIFMHRETLAAKLATYPTGEDIPTAYSTTLIASHRIFSPDAPSMAELYAATRLDLLYPWRVPPQWNREASPSKKEPRHNATYGEYVAAVYRVLPNRKFCLSRKGYMGLMPLEAENGDKIVLLSGGRTPYVVRKAKSGMWSFRGECYLHGMMHGEGWDPDKEMQEFRFV